MNQVKDPDPKEKVIEEQPTPPAVPEINPTPHHIPGLSIDPKEVPPPRTEEDAKPSALDQLEEKAEKLGKVMDGIAGFVKHFDSTIEQVKKRLQDIEDKLPQTITPNRATVKGYYNFDEKKRTFVDAQARSEYDTAKELIGIIDQWAK